LDGFHWSRLVLNGEVFLCQEYAPAVDPQFLNRGSDIVQSTANMDKISVSARTLPWNDEAWWGLADELNEGLDDGPLQRV
jgi:hypothetical protein